MGDTRQAKEFLMQYRNALRYRQHLERLAREQREMAAARAQGVRSPRGTALGVRVQTSPDGQAMARAIVEAVDAQREAQLRIEQAAARAAQLLAQVLAVVDQVPAMERRSLLVMRYLNGTSWRRIQAELGCSERQTFKLHRAALQEVDQILDKMTIVQ